MTKYSNVAMALVETIILLSATCMLPCTMSIWLYKPFIIAMAIVVMTRVYEVSRPCTLLSGCYVGISEHLPECCYVCLRLFVVVIYCYHGDGSAGRHVCTKYHGHT